MNKLIPLLLIGVLAIVGVIAFTATKGGSQGQAGVVSSAKPGGPTLPAGRKIDQEAQGISDAVGYSNQLNATTMALERVTKEFETYQMQERSRTEAVLKREMSAVSAQIEKQVRERVLDDMRKAQESQQQLIIDRTRNEIDSKIKQSGINNPDMAASNPIMRAGHPEVSPKITTGSSRLLDPAKAEIPSGFGFDGLPPTASGPSSLQNQRVRSSIATGLPSGAYVVTPSQTAGYMTVSAFQPPLTPNLGKPGLSGAHSKSIGKGKNTSSGKKAKPEPVPIYTIENTSTLFSNTTMTALMGVVPTKNGAIKYPFRFKVITGAENIASNGLYLPDVKDIIWTGFAFGNREMSCVQAIVDTVTFTFQDGTIRTVKKASSGKAGSLTDGLGYLSDRWGKPCIRGELISNASKYLRDRMIAAGAAATAEAAAATETTTVNVGDSGSSISSVTGNQSDYIVGKTGSASLKELADYLRDRMDQAIDVVYLDAGKDVVIHVEQEIAIDYDPAGRKLSHIAASSTARTRLD